MSNLAKSSDRKCKDFSSKNIATIGVGVNPTGLAIAKDNKNAYICNNNNYGAKVDTGFNADSVSIVDLKKKRLIKTIYDPSFSQPYTITLNKDNTKAYVSNSNSSFPGTVSVIDIETSTVTGVISGFDGPSGFVILEGKDKNKSKAYVNNYGGIGGVGSGNGNTVSIVDLKTNTITGSIILSVPPNPAAAPAAMALTINQKFLYVVNYVQGLAFDGMIQIIRTSDDQLMPTTITGLFGPFSIAMSPDEKWSYVTNFGSNNFSPYGTTVSVIDLSKNIIIKNINVGIQPAGVTFSPKENHLAFVTTYNSLYNSYYCNPIPPNTGNYTTNILTPGEGLVVVIDTKSHKVLSTIAVGQSPGRVKVTPDGQNLIVSNYTSNTIKVIDF